MCWCTARITAATLASGMDDCGCVPWVRGPMLPVPRGCGRRRGRYRFTADGERAVREAVAARDGRPAGGPSMGGMDGSGGRHGFVAVDAEHLDVCGGTETGGLGPGLTVCGRPPGAAVHASGGAVPGPVGDRETFSAAVEELARMGAVVLAGAAAGPHPEPCGGLIGLCPVCIRVYRAVMGDVRPGCAGCGGWHFVYEPCGDPPGTGRCADLSCDRLGRFARFGGLDICPPEHIAALAWVPKWAPCLACGAPVAYEPTRMVDVHLGGGMRFADPAVDARHRIGASIAMEEQMDDRMAVARAVPLEVDG